MVVVPAAAALVLTADTDRLITFDVSNNLISAAVVFLDTHLA